MTMFVMRNGTEFLFFNSHPVLDRVTVADATDTVFLDREGQRAFYVTDENTPQGNFLLKGIRDGEVRPLAVGAPVNNQ